MQGADPSNRQFLILHGWQNHRPRDHWQWWLTDQLRRAGMPTTYPQFPDADEPSLSQWSKLLRAEWELMHSATRTVIAHSLGTLLWMDFVARGHATGGADRVLLVSPPSRTVLARHPEVEEFSRIDVSTTALISASARTSFVVGDHDDEYCPEGLEAAYPRLDLPVQTLIGGAHVNPASGYGPWLDLLEWCLDPGATQVPVNQS